MCKYYAHSHQCGHTITVLASQCSSAAITRRPCGKGDICATLKVDETCSKCPSQPTTPPPRSKKKGIRRD